MRKILSWFNEYKNYLLTFNDYHFIHGDLWYENYILNDNNELVGIVDFEGSGMGDPAYDIAALYYLGTGFINMIMFLLDMDKYIKCMMNFILTIIIQKQMK